MKINVANMLTLSRLVLVPFYIASFALGYKGEAFVIFCIAGTTDLIDGTVARFFGEQSKWGALIDPVADKLLMQSCFISLVVTGFIPQWFFALAFARDLVIVSGIFYLERKKFELPYKPTWISKFATLFQLGVAVLGLLRWWNPSLELADWQMWTIYITAALIIISGVKYVLMGFEILRKKNTTSCPKIV